MEDFVAYPSRWRIVLMILGAIGFVALGLWMVGAFGPPPTSHRSGPIFTFVWGWVSIAFFGWCGVLGVKRLFDTGEELRIGTNGIRWARWSDQTIPWSEISDVTIWSYQRQKLIILHLRNPDLYLRSGIRRVFVSTNRALTGGDIGISLAPTDRSFGEAMTAIEHFRQNTP